MVSFIFLRYPCKIKVIYIIISNIFRLFLIILGVR